MIVRACVRGLSQSLAVILLAVVALVTGGSGCSSGRSVAPPGQAGPKAEAGVPGAEAGTAGVEAGVTDEAGVTAEAGVVGVDAGDRARERRERARRSPLGTNLVLMKPWSGEWPFKDVVRQGMTWRSERGMGVADSRPLRMDAAGWITQLEAGQRAAMRFFNGARAYPAGLYFVTWEGDGRLEYENVQVVGQQSASATIRADGTTTFGVHIVSTNPANPLRNLRVIMPGGSCASDETAYCTTDADCGGSTCQPFAATVATQPYHPTFLRSNEPYSTLRFMHWAETIGTPVRTWSQRVPPDAATYVPAGVPYEAMIQLCNTLGTDIWLTTPLHADDDYITRLANLVRDSLGPEQKVYIEYSNEVWNAGFPMFGETRDAGLRAGLGPDPYVAMQRQYARRAVAMFRVFTTAFGPTASSRVVRVLAGHSESDYGTRTQLDFEDSFRHADAYAIAPYFGGGVGWPGGRDRLVNSTVEQVLDFVRTDELPRAIQTMTTHAALLASYTARRGGTPLTMLAYEGGQHLVGVGEVQSDARATALFHGANRHATMGTLYGQYLDAWRRNNGQLFVHFVHTQLPTEWGVFGLIERPDQSRAESPKLDAVLRFVEQNPRWW